MEALLISTEAVGKALGISRAAVYSLHASGQFGLLPIHLGRRTLWDREELLAWVKAKCPRRDVWQKRKNQPAENLYDGQNL